VLTVVQDDFSGLMPITKSLFPKADVQLCIVHYAEPRIMLTRPSPAAASPAHDLHAS
jgi:transposase-like protein